MPDKAAVGGHPGVEQGTDALPEGRVEAPVLFFDWAVGNGSTLSATR